MSIEVKNEELNNESAPIEKKEEFVSKKAYEDVKSDMFKFKTQMKEQEALLNQMRADKDLIENEKLAEQGKWEEIAQKSKLELDTMRSERNVENEKFINFHKKNSVLQEIGGFKKTEYSNFINVDNIELNDDGSVNGESMKVESDRIRQNYAELLNNSSSNKLPNEAPRANEIGEANPSSMNDMQKNAYFKELIRQKKG